MYVRYSTSKSTPHIHNALVADVAVVCPRRLRLLALLAVPAPYATLRPPPPPPHPGMMNGPPVGVDTHPFFTPVDISVHVHVGVGVGAQTGVDIGVVVLAVAVAPDVDPRHGQG